MSLSLGSELRVVLCRDRVLLVRVARELTLTGVTYQVLEKSQLACVEDADSPWRSALNTLAAALSAMPKKPASAQVILSNSFLRYTMIPWSESLTTTAEEMVFATHCFKQLYGIQAESWELKMSQGDAREAQLASAVERELLNTLRTLFSAARVKLKSVQPYLMSAFNNCHVSLKQHDAWLVVFEQGNLCLGLIQHGHWSSVRTIKVAGDWLEKLPEILDRETYLSELEASSDKVFVWAPEQWKESLPKSTSWKIHKLQPKVHRAFVSEYDARFAVALCG